MPVGRAGGVATGVPVRTGRGVIVPVGGAMVGTIGVVSVPPGVILAVGTAGGGVKGRKVGVVAAMVPVGAATGGEGLGATILGHRPPLR